MELPLDVLSIIYAFSRPCMRFYKEYRLGLTELGFAHNEHWVLLRKRLCMSDADQVFAVFLAYKETTLFLRHLSSLPFKVPYGQQLYYVTYHAEREKQLLKWKKLEQELRGLLGEARGAKHEQWELDYQ